MRRRLLAAVTLRPRPAAILAAGLTVAVLGLASMTHTYSGQNAGLTVGTDGCSVGIEWHGDPGLFGSCTGTDPDAAPGEDNRDGRIEEDESGWDCHRMGNRACGPQGDASHTSR
jgi:hypothetical protein